MGKHIMDTCIIVSTPVLFFFWYLLLFNIIWVKVFDEVSTVQLWLVLLLTGVEPFITRLKAVIICIMNSGYNGENIKQLVYCSGCLFFHFFLNFIWLPNITVIIITVTTIRSSFLVFPLLF